ncbi:MAG: hypothetical protein VKK42_10575 [Lyngbya sp.]|nr:hypothetical protein [Lyngbya sp.]
MSFDRFFQTADRDRWIYLIEGLRVDSFAEQLLLEIEILCISGDRLFGS